PLARLQGFPWRRPCPEHAIRREEHPLPVVLLGEHPPEADALEPPAAPPPREVDEASMRRERHRGVDRRSPVEADDPDEHEHAAEVAPCLHPESARDLESRQSEALEVSRGEDER